MLKVVKHKVAEVSLEELRGRKIEGVVIARRQKETDYVLFNIGLREHLNSEGGGTYTGNLDDDPLRLVWLPVTFDGPILTTIKELKGFPNKHKAITAIIPLGFSVLIFEDMEEYIQLKYKTQST